MQCTSRSACRRRGLRAARRARSEVAVDVRRESVRQDVAHCSAHTPGLQAIPPAQVVPLQHGCPCIPHEQACPDGPPLQTRFAPHGELPGQQGSPWSPHGTHCWLGKSPGTKRTPDRSRCKLVRVPVSVVGRGRTVESRGATRACLGYFSRPPQDRSGIRHGQSLEGGARS
jgi:hypothetical protein